MNEGEFGFKIVDELASADFIFDARGRTLNDLFVTCARACFFAMTDLDKVAHADEINVSVEGENTNELLYNFIAELIYLKDVEKIFLSDFKVDISEDRKSLVAVARGERIDYNKHVIKTDVKAVTYHGLDIIGDSEGFRVRMVLDL
jgi:SHS2 domain-containing protein